MQQITIQRTDINPERLQEELANIDGYKGFTINSEGTTIFLEDGTSPTVFRDAVAAHQSDTLSTAQQERDTLRSEIIALKQTIGDIDTLSATEATTAIKLIYKALKLRGLI